MRFPNNGMMGMAILGAVGLAGAHLVDGSLSIKGGESFTSGQSVTLTWSVTVVHTDGTNIDLSNDGGTTWTSVKSGIKEVSGTNSYKMNMPTAPAAHAKIRVCQGSTTACASIKASQPSSPPYALISPEFTITGTSALQKVDSHAFAVGFDPFTGKVEASFELAQAGEVVIQAFDTQGRVGAELLRAPFSAGDHRLSIEAPRTLVSSPVLVFRLKLGETVRTQAVTRP